MGHLFCLNFIKPKLICLMYLTAQLNKPWPSCSTLAPTNMGSSCHFPATPLGMARQHGFFAVRTESKHTMSIQSAPPPGRSRTKHSPQSLIQIGIARTRRRILQHRTHRPHGLVPCPTILVEFECAIYSGQVASEQHHNLKFSTQSSPLLQFPTKKEN